MKKSGIIIFVVFAISSSVYGAEEGRIVMHFSEKNDLLKFVFQTTSESMITAASVNESYSIVKIDFPENFSIDTASLPEPLKITQKGKSLYLNIKNIVKLKVSRYAGPPRLVIDAYTSGLVLTSQPPVATRTNDIASLSVLLDAGHGGSDTGIISGQFRESALTLSLCANLVKRLKVSRVGITRKDDSTVSPSQRITEIRKVKPNVFISIHVSTADVFAIYTSSFPAVMSGPDMAYNSSYAQAAYLDKSRALSKAIGNALNEKFKTQTTFREMPIQILSNASAAAVLIEMPNPASFAYDTDAVNSISEALGKAISDYAKK